VVPMCVHACMRWSERAGLSLTTGPCACLGVRHYRLAHTRGTQPECHISGNIGSRLGGCSGPGRYSGARAPRQRRSALTGPDRGTRRRCPPLRRAAGRAGGVGAPRRTAAARTGPRCHPPSHQSHQTAAAVSEPARVAVMIPNRCITTPRHVASIMTATACMQRLIWAAPGPAAAGRDASRRSGESTSPVV